MSTHYETLGVAWKAAPEELQDARRRLARQHHPDFGGDAWTMAAINAAYDVLTDDKAHKRYRAELRSTHRDCSACKGEGGRAKQKSFTQTVFIVCVHCKGSGLQEK